MKTTKTRILYLLLAICFLGVSSCSSDDNSLNLETDYKAPFTANIESKNEMYSLEMESFKINTKKEGNVSVTYKHKVSINNADNVEIYNSDDIRQNFETELESNEFKLRFLKSGEYTLSVKSVNSLGYEYISKKVIIVKNYDFDIEISDIIFSTHIPKEITIKPVFKQEVNTENMKFRISYFGNEFGINYNNEPYILNTIKDFTNSDFTFTFKEQGNVKLKFEFILGAVTYTIEKALIVNESIVDVTYNSPSVQATQLAMVDFSIISEIPNETYQVEVTNSEQFNFNLNNNVIQKNTKYDVMKNFNISFTSDTPITTNLNVKIYTSTNPNTPIVKTVPVVFSAMPIEFDFVATITPNLELKFQAFITNTQTPNLKFTTIEINNTDYHLIEAHSSYGDRRVSINDAREFSIKSSPLEMNGSYILIDPLLINNSHYMARQFFYVKPSLASQSAVKFTVKLTDNEGNIYYRNVSLVKP